MGKKFKVNLELNLDDLVHLKQVLKSSIAEDDAILKSPACLSGTQAPYRDLSRRVTLRLESTRKLYNALLQLEQKIRIDLIVP